MKLTEKKIMNALEKVCTDNTILLPWRKPRFKNGEGHCTCSYSLSQNELRDRYTNSTCKYKGCEAVKVTAILLEDGRRTQLYTYECKYERVARNIPLNKKAQED